jgi:peroxiredoxin
MHKFAALLLLGSLPAAFLTAQNPAAAPPATAQIQFQIVGLKTPSALFGYYYAGEMYRLDSVATDTSTGRFRLDRPRLTPGVYFVAAAGNRLFDFVVPSPTGAFSVRGSMARLDSLRAEGSAENAAFFDFERKRKALEAKMAAKRSMFEVVQRASQNDPEALKPLREEMQKLVREVDALGADFQRKHPGHLYARVLRSIEVPDMPQSLRDSPNKKAPMWWTKTHYFDRTNWKDSTLLRNPMWPVFFDNYFNRLTEPTADSIIASADRVLKKIPKNGPFYRFAAVTLTSNFEQSEFVGADRIFVHLMDVYHKKGHTPWVDSVTLMRLQYKADVHRPNLTGKVAPALELPDDTGKPVSLHGIDAPMTLLVFYSPLCEHCQKSMPGIYQTWLDYRSKTGLQAVAVNTDDQHQHWQQYVAQQGWEWIDLSDPAGKNLGVEKNYAPFNLPVIYILDKDKKILRKRVEVERLGEVLGAMGKG